MKVSQRGIDLIKKFEGLRLKAYQCPAGVWTVGYGHTGDDVTKDTVITAEYSEVLLKRDIARFVSALENFVKPPVALRQPEVDALVSFMYNIGIGAFSKSTLLKKLNAAAPRSEIAEEFLRWVKVAGVPNAGLRNRRVAERALYMEADK